MPLILHLKPLEDAQVELDTENDCKALAPPCLIQAQAQMQQAGVVERNVEAHERSDGRHALPGAPHRLPVAPRVRRAQHERRQRAQAEQQVCARQGHRVAEPRVALGVRAPSLIYTFGIIFQRVSTVLSFASLNFAHFGVVGDELW